MVRRIHISVLAGAEKRLLEFLARAMPSWVTPDALTSLGLAGAATAFAGYLLGGSEPDYLWLASAGLVLHWFGDSLDGTLARVRAQERPRYGFYLDQTVDITGDILIMLGLGLSPFARLDSALLALLAYYALAVRSLVWCIVRGEHRISSRVAGPTELRLGLIATNFLLWKYGAPVGFLSIPRLTWCDLLLLSAFAVMLVMFAVGTIADVRALRAGREDADQRS